MESKGWDDISYNWIVGGDGSVYEGRGRLFAFFNRSNINLIQLKVGISKALTRADITQDLLELPTSVLSSTNFPIIDN